MNSNVIGSADGPTHIILASQYGLSWMNFFGFGIVILMLLPNMIYAVKYRGLENVEKHGACCDSNCDRTPLSD